jgi:hypothetical protein
MIAANVAVQRPPDARLLIVDALGATREIRAGFRFGAAPR